MMINIWYLIYTAAAAAAADDDGGDENVADIAANDLASPAAASFCRLQL